MNIYKIRETSAKPKTKGGVSYGKYNAISIAYMEKEKEFRGAYPGVDEVFRSPDLHVGRTTKSFYIRAYSNLEDAVYYANHNRLDRNTAIKTFEKAYEEA